MMIIRRHVWAIALFLNLSFGLEVSPDSPCAKKCIDDPANGNVSDSDSSLAFGKDFPCLDSNYVGNTTTSDGKKLKECQACLQSSGYEDPSSEERDTQWFLFQLRGAADYCIFGRFGSDVNENISETQPWKDCFSACNPIYDSSDYRARSDLGGYSYCDSKGNYTSDAQSCMKCLYDAEGLTILGNVVTALTAMCAEKPGKNISFKADVYNTKPITSTSTSASMSSTSSSPSSTSSTSTDDSGLSKGALAGIVLGVLVAIAAVLAGILLLLRRTKKQREGRAMEISTAGGMDHAPPYQYISVEDHKYAQHGVRPANELPGAGTAELDGESSPTQNRVAELEAGR